MEITHASFKKLENIIGKSKKTNIETGIKKFIDWYLNIKMNKIAIVISSKNNYEMLEKEVIKNNEFQNFTFINIDDNSDKDQIKKGREICKKNNIVFTK